MATDASGAIFAPIFKGQTSADPEELIDLAIAGAEFHPEYLASHGGSWRDPFTGTPVGQTEGGDWTGVTRMQVAGPGDTLVGGGPEGMFDPVTGERTGDPFADPHITSGAEGMDPADLLERAKALSLASTFVYDRQAVADSYGISADDIAAMGDTVRELGLSGSGITDGTFSMGGRPDGLVDDPWIEVPITDFPETPVGETPVGEAPSATEQRSATDIVRNILETYGLGELLNDPDLDLINLWVTAGDAAAVWARVRQSDPYKDRFPGMADLSAAGRAVTEATYIELERGYIEIMNAAGIDPGFYDEPSDFGALIGGDVSVNEFNQRVALAVEATTRMTSEVREQLATYYPEVTDGDLTAYYLDPERATNIFEEREKIGAARIGGIAVETGFGSVSRQTAERLRASGVTETAARRGFQAIAPSTLAEETASESLDRDPVTGRPMMSSAVVGQQKPGDITSEELVGAEFGTDPQAARRIEARRQRRLAAFAQKGGPAMTGGGYTGLGTAT